MDSREEKFHKYTKQRYINYQRVFGSEEGKRVLYDMMEYHSFLKPTYEKGDPHETAFNEGGRNVILRILTYINADIEALEKRMKEGARNAITEL